MNVTFFSEPIYIALNFHVELGFKSFTLASASPTLLPLASYAGMVIWTYDFSLSVLFFNTPVT